MTKNYKSARAKRTGRSEQIERGANRLLSFLSCLALLMIASGFHGKANGFEKEPQENRTIVLTTMLPRHTFFIFSGISVLYEEAFSRLGCGFKLISQPGERALVDADQGILDGEAARIMSLDMSKYPNLIVVPHPITVIEVHAYSTDYSIEINGWESLAVRQYKAGYLKGSKSIEQNLPLYVDKANIITLNDPEQGLKMLKAKRIDLFIVNKQIEKTELMKNGAYEDVQSVGFVETKTLYPWLHKRNKNLVQPLADVLKTMKSEGRF